MKPCATMEGQLSGSDNDRYLTPRELVERWRNEICVRTLANWRCQSIGPRYTKLGGKILYRLSEVTRWEEARTVDGTAHYRRQE